MSSCNCLPTSLPQPVLTFLKWLELTQGRDKLLRFVAYFSKFVVEVMQQQAYSKEAIERISKPASAIGLTRKLMRFFRSVEYLNELLKALQTKDEVEKLLSVIKSFSLMVWMIMDHIQWMNKVGYFTIAKDTLKKIDEVHSKGWFYGLLMGLIIAVYKLYNINNSLQKTLTSTAPKEDISKEVATLNSNKQKQIQSLIKSSIDILIPSARLDYLPLSDGVVGLAGSVTSVIGMMDTWPKSK